MSANRRSFALTDLYRSRLLSLGERVENAARQSWPDIAGLDESPWPDQMAQVVTRAQVEGVRLSAAYLAAYVRSETGSGRVQTIETRRYVGFARSGRPLKESLHSPFIAVLSALKSKAPDEALKLGLDKALRMIDLDVMHAARRSLNEAMEADPRVEGWQRGVRGSCGACMGDVSVEVSVQLPGVPLMVHPNCQCVTVPVVTGVLNRFPLPTGSAIFASKTRAEQDDALGPEAAERVRSGDLALADLVSESHLETAEDFITQKPLEAAI